MKQKEPRLTMSTMKVLKAFMDNPHDQLSGIDITNKVGTKSGTLYPILIRLEEAGWLNSQWEMSAPEQLGRPRRRFYELTGKGQRAAQNAFNELEMNVRGVAWSI